MARPAGPTLDPDAWVEAAPFAAHLAHLCSLTGLPWPVVALHAGITLRVAEALLHGRRGRRVHRIARGCAQRILAVDPDDLARLRRRWVDADATTARVAALVARGVPLRRLAAQLGVPQAEVAALADGCRATVPAVLALRARAAYEAADRHVLRVATRAA